MAEPVVILGAGLAGLSCAYHLGHGFRIVERDDGVGGVARTFVRNGFRFDVTGHWLHVKNDAMRRLVHDLLGEALVTVQRRANIYSHGVTTPYPFQANTHGLPPQVVAECLLGYFRAREGTHTVPRNFDEFIRQRMGDGIAEHFMIPYNTKLWTVPPSELAFDCCQGFVPLPSPEEVVWGAVQTGGAGDKLGYNATFVYPLEGIGALAARLAARLERPVEHSEVVSVDVKKRQVRLRDGASISYRKLVSTLPLKTFVGMLPAAPEAVRAAAQVLRATQLTYWDLGFRGANGPKDAHWTYFPDKDIPFYRAGSASAAVANLAPAGHRSYYVEVAHPQDQPCSVTDAEILRGLRRVGLIAAQDEPVVMHRSTVGCAYVIMDHAYGTARATVLDWLGTQDVMAIGRYGAWTYDSMEGALLQGRTAAQRLLEAH